VPLLAITFATNSQRIRGTGKDGGGTSSQRFQYAETLILEIEVGTWTDREPFTIPTERGAQTVDYRARSGGRAEQLLPAPGNQKCYVAFAFPTEQNDSDGQLTIRRGEDWARNGHNGMTLTETAQCITTSTTS
jgi:hypothetical protein